MDYYKCPFCGGAKTKPFVRNGTNQNCTECNQEGMISQKKIAEYGIKDFIDGYVKKQKRSNNLPRNQFKRKVKNAI